MVRSCQQGLVMALKRQRRARIFQKRRNVFEMFGDEQLIKQVTFPQLFKTSKEHLHYQTTLFARVLCDLHCMMNESLTLIYTARVCGALQLHSHRS